MMDWAAESAILELILDDVHTGFRNVHSRIIHAKDRIHGVHKFIMDIRHMTHIFPGRRL